LARALKVAEEERAVAPDRAGKDEAIEAREVSQLRYLTGPQVHQKERASITVL
jgi:hypothetical protein